MTDKLRVGVVTSLRTPCGISEYGKALRESLSQHFFADLLETVWVARDQKPAYDAFLLNWHPGRLAVDVTDLRDLLAHNKATILLIHNTLGHLLDDETLKLVEESSAAIAHEEVDHPKVVQIPHGILEVADLPEPTETRSVGTGGFLFPWKRPELVIDVARELRCYANMVCPPYPEFINPNDLERRWTERMGGPGSLLIEKAYLPVAEAVQRLARSWVNIFYFDSSTPGSQDGRSGSVRLGIAARRPLVLSRHRKLEDLYAYEDELYFAESDSDVRRQVQGIFEALMAGSPVRRPARLLRDMGWSAVGGRIAEVIKKAHAERRSR